MKSWRAVLALLILAFGPASASTQKHEDSRCLCKCPDVSTVYGVKNAVCAEEISETSYVDPFSSDIPDETGFSGPGSSQNIYVNSSVSPEDCDCQHVVLVKLNLTDQQAKSFCPRCHCKFQIRSLTIVRVVVILVIWIISILVIYMFFLSCLDPILNNKRGAARSGVSYREQHDDIDEDSSIEGSIRGQGPANSTQMRAVGGDVINRLGNQQTKWKKQVQEQRRNIYDRHTILN